MNYLYLSIGAVLGCLARYSVSQYFKTETISFPWATFIVNCFGAFLIGAIFGYTQQFQTLEEKYKLLIIVGFLGAFTTFSSFALESLQLFQAQKYSLLLTYIIATNSIGLILVYLGYIIYNRI